MRTKSLILVPRTRDDALSAVEAMRPEDRAEVSAEWLARVRAAARDDPWLFGFSMVLRESGLAVGGCGFKGPPEEDGIVEIAYGVDPEHWGKGYATEAAAALVGFAFGHDPVRVVRAHTLPEPNASTRVLTKCGFRFLGEVIDPEDGLVWRWEKHRNGTRVGPVSRPANEET